MGILDLLIRMENYLTHCCSYDIPLSKLIDLYIAVTDLFEDRVDSKSIKGFWLLDFKINNTI